MSIVGYFKASVPFFPHSVICFLHPLWPYFSYTHSLQLHFVTVSVCSDGVGIDFVEYAHQLCIKRFSLLSLICNQMKENQSAKPSWHWPIKNIVASIASRCKIILRAYCSWLCRSVFMWNTSSEQWTVQLIYLCMKWMRQHFNEWVQAFLS